MTANMDIRVQMFREGVTQADLGERLGMNQPEVSTMLKHELSREQKKRIKAAITEIIKEREGEHEETVG